MGFCQGGFRQIAQTHILNRLSLAAMFLSVLTDGILTLQMGGQAVEENPLAHILLEWGTAPFFGIRLALVALGSGFLLIRAPRTLWMLAALYVGFVGWMGVLYLIVQY